MPLTFTALKTAVPQPAEAYGQPLLDVGRRGKYLLLRFEPVTFIVHLMQGGRLLVDAKQSAKPRNGQARFVFEGPQPALLLTEAGTERRAGVWCVPPRPTTACPTAAARQARPGGAGGDARASWPTSFAAHNMRIHGYLRDQHMIAGLGRMLANEVCHRAKISPFAMTGKLGADGAAKIVDGDPRGDRRGPRVRAHPHRT